MFERQHHQRIALILLSLDAPLLREHNCYFGGGTAIALRYGEYRESVDIDFLISDVAGYRALRQLLTGTQGIAAMARAGAPWSQPRETRADQYGIRAMLQLGDVGIKLAIVLEARISLELPGPEDDICGIACLTPLDLAASKLLANADRWRDDGVFSRDVIDLAMMQPSSPLFRQAMAKAHAAYGNSVANDLAKAITHLKTRAGRLERCMTAMEIELPKALIWQRLRGLERALARQTLA